MLEHFVCKVSRNVFVSPPNVTAFDIGEPGKNITAKLHRENTLSTETVYFYKERQ